MRKTYLIDIGLLVVAVTIPKEWTGVWETDGCTKIWVIYSEDGSRLE